MKIHVLALVASAGIALTGGQVVASDVTEAVAADVARPVRQGGVNGQAYWNERSVMFMYPPSFDFKKVDGAVKYRYVVEDDARRDYRFEDDTPNETLARLWPQLPNGMLRLEVQAIGPEKRPIGLAGYRRFWKSASFDPAACPKAACGYAEAATKYYDWLWETPMVQSYLTNGVPCEDYVYSSFPCKTDGAIVRAFVAYAKMRPDRAAASLTVARRAADFLISLMLPAGSPLEHFPPTYRILSPSVPFGPQDSGADKVARRYLGQNMIVYPAMVAMSFLDLYKTTGEAKYLESAKKIAGTYVKLQGADGTWYLKLGEKDGAPVAPNRLFPMSVCSLMERLYEITGDGKYRKAADRGFAFVEQGPLADWNWDAQYEDVEPSRRFRNLTIHTPLQTAKYLLSRYPGDLRRREQARECLRFAEDQFVAWKPPFRADGTGPLGKDTPMILKGDYSMWYPVPGAFEQYDWYLPIDSAAGVMVGGYLAFYRAEGNAVDLAKAKALGAAVTIMQRNNGKGGAIPTHWLKWEVGPEVKTQPWINCGIATADALVDLSSFERCALAGCASSGTGGSAREERTVRKIRVACIGDSITWGTAMTNRTEECYPAQLQRLLGGGYEVRNFGDPGSCCYSHPPKPRKDEWRPHSWRLGKQGPLAYEYKPDIVVSNLGINDQAGYIREFIHGADGKPEVEQGLFRKEYSSLLGAFRREDGSSPRIIMWTRLGPLGKKHPAKGSPNPFVMERDLELVARDVGAETLDMYTPLLPYCETADFAADGVHPEGGAQRVIAERTARLIVQQGKRLVTAGR